MQIDFRGRNVPVTEELREHAERRLVKVARQVSEDTMSAASGPSTFKTSLRSWDFAALTRASTASSGVLKDC